jgi:hypothetical protein
MDPEKTAHARLPKAPATAKWTASSSTGVGTSFASTGPPDLELKVASLVARTEGGMRTADINK